MTSGGEIVGPGRDVVSTEKLNRRINVNYTRFSKLVLDKVKGGWREQGDFHYNCKERKRHSGGRKDKREVDNFLPYVILISLCYCLVGYRSSLQERRRSR